MADRIRASVDEFGSCIFGVSGGSTPGPIYEQLGKTAGIDWNCVTVFAVDERHVPRDRAESNYHLLSSTLLKHAVIPEENIVFPRVDLSVADCIADFDARISALLQIRPPDFVTLGLGPDGHVASLFPTVSEGVLSTTRSVVHTTTAMFASFDRITVTPRVLVSAKAHVFFLQGQSKYQVWQQMLEEPNMPSRWPAQLVLATGRATLLYESQDHI